MESSTPDKQPVRVTILSRSYTLLTAGDPRETEEVAASVDELMLSIAARAVTKEDLICITGSFYLVGEAKKYFAAKQALAEQQQKA